MKIVLSPIWGYRHHRIDRSPSQKHDRGSTARGRRMWRPCDATSRGFAHNDGRALDTLLSRIRHGFPRGLIAIEAVYSMDGDYAGRARFVDIKTKPKAMLLVDEAHSLATMGRTGRGIVTTNHTESRVGQTVDAIAVVLAQT